MGEPYYRQTEKLFMGFALALILAVIGYYFKR